MSFLNVVEIESALAALAATYPSISSLISLPNRTAERRQSHALVIGTGRGCPEAGVLIISGAHGREWGGPDIVINFATDLLEAYTMGSGLTYGGTSFTSGQIRSIVERVDVVVFPCINPDGRHHSQTAFAMWRKNRNPASSGGQASNIGVDPNRNYDFLWDFNTAYHPNAVLGGTLASTAPSSDLFHGTAPFSEAETLNVRWILENFAHIGWFMDLHSYGGDILHPWGDDNNQMSTTDKNFTNPVWNGHRGIAGDSYGEFIMPCDFAKHVSAANDMKAAILGVNAQSYAIAQSFLLPSWGSPYPTSGASDDYTYSRNLVNPRKKKIFSFCIEFNLKKTFFPTWDEIQPIILDIDAGLVQLCLRAVPRFNFPTWLCAIREWLNEAIWHRVFPPELWGPYGPWGRLRLVFETVFHPIVAPFVRRSRGSGPTSRPQ